MIRHSSANSAILGYLVQDDAACRLESRWKEMQRPAWYASSVAPALIAWPAMLIPLRLAAPLLVAGFIAHYLQDRRLASQARLPPWYLPLRLRLRMVACACLIAGGLASRA
jgi:hypothetical protein